MHQSTDQQPANSLPPEQHSSVDSTEGPSLAEEVAELPTPLTKKRRWARYSRHPVFKRRRRVACLVLGLLLLVAAGGVLLFSNPEWVDSEPVQRIISPAVGEAPKMVEEEAAESEASEGETASEEAAEQEEGTPVPDDPTLHLTVPRLGLYGHTVRNDDSEEALDQGAIKLPYTGFPWQEEDTNTYIACHRLGWSGTESYNQCLNLPSMQEGDKIFLEDANDTVYAYRVVETLTVGPEDTWVTGPVAGEDMVSLQTCVETLDDLGTLGPDWTARFVVRAERVEEGEARGFRRIVEDPVAAYAGLLRHIPYLASYHGRILKTAESTAVLSSKAITVFATEALLDLERLTLSSNLPYPFV